MAAVVDETVSSEDEIDVEGVQYVTEEISREPFEFEKIVTVMIGDPYNIGDADALINFCMGNVHSGNDTFLRAHQLAGDELKNACHNFRGTGPGFARLSCAYDLLTFKRIAHAVLPMVETKFTGLAPHLTYLCILSALDAVAEDGLRTVIMPTPFGIDPNVCAYLVLLTVKKWLQDNPDRLSSIHIVCENETDFFSYHSQVPAIATVNDFTPEAFDEFFTHLQYTNLDFNEHSGYAEAEENYEQFYSEEQQDEYDENMVQVRRVDMNMSNISSYGDASDMFEQRTLIRNIQMHAEEPDTREIQELYQKLFYLPDGGIRLQLSRNLSPTMLPIEDPDGRIRQYRLTTQSRNGDAYYFRCSHCEFLSKKTDTQYRPKMTVRDGSIVGSYYPMHHPECLPISKRQVIVQQLDRQARCKIMDQNMMMREMYEKEQNMGSAEVTQEELSEHHQLEESMDHEVMETKIDPSLAASISKVKFPSWEQVRKQYYRLRAKGEKLAAAGQRRNTTAFVDAVPILVQPDEKAITADVIQRAERQFDVETYGMEDVDESASTSDKVKQEVMYQPQIYTTYSSTSTAITIDEDSPDISVEAEYYNEPAFSSKVSRLTEVVVKEETEDHTRERQQAKRQMLGMPSYSSMIMSGDNRFTPVRNRGFNTTEETEYVVEEAPQQPSTSKRVSIIRNVTKPRVAIVPRTRKRTAIKNTAAEEGEAPLKKTSVDPASTEVNEEAVGEEVLSTDPAPNIPTRRSSRTSVGKLPARFAD